MQGKEGIKLARLHDNFTGQVKVICGCVNVLDINIGSPCDM